MYNCTREQEQRCMKEEREQNRKGKQKEEETT